MDQLRQTSTKTDGSLACLSSASSHALLLPYPAQSHLNPYMQLAKRLAAQDVRVTVATIEHVHAKIVRAQQLALGSTHLQLNNNLRLLGIKDGLPHDFDREGWSEELRNAIEKTLEEGALDLIHKLASEGNPVTCIVGDFFLLWTCSLAERAAVPEIIFWPQCASMFSIYLHVDAIISSGYDPFDGNVRAAAAREATMAEIACIQGLPKAIHPADLPFESPFGKSVLEWMREVLRERFRCMGKAHGVIANSFEALEPEIYRALTLEFENGAPHPQYKHCWPRTSLRLVGPLLPSAVVDESASGDNDLVSGASLWEEEVEECRQWLDAQPAASVLFVAFGSIMAISVAQVQELAVGLAASGKKFLWVIREKAIKATALQGPPASMAMVDSVPLEDALPQGFLELNQHLCKVVRWAPQALVLSHPSVGGFFSHCGWNSTFESVCCGVPILGWPWLMDQVTNCWLVTHVWKVGLTLQRDQENQTSRKYVEEGVRQLMAGPLAPSMRARARELRDLAREAARKSDGVVSLVQDIRNLSAPENKLELKGESIAK